MTVIVNNGYTDLPAGFATAIATFLEMRAPPAARTLAPDPPDVTLVRVPAPDVAAYRALFRRVGANWLWNSRLRLDDEALAAVLTDPAVEVSYPVRDGAPVGILELDFRAMPSVEIAFFGLLAEETGKGLGRWLMNRALAIAWRGGVERVWLHTCTFDHPAALGFYRRSGFTPYARKIEMFPDPRLDGTLPREAAPHVPLIGG